MNFRRRSTHGATDRVNVLFTCVGRRVALVRAFQQAAESLGLRCRTVGTDVNPYSAGLYACNRAIITPPMADKAFIPELLAAVKAHKIDLIVPTIDTGLGVLAAHTDAFRRLGATILVSSPEVVGICQDKRRAYEFLVDHGFDTPVTTELSRVKMSRLQFPVFLKPWDGSASRGNAVVRSADEFRFWSRRVPNCIVQEYIEGQEFTCDVYVDLAMMVRTVVARKRIEVRAGEVSKSQTVKQPKLMNLCRRLVETLGAGPGVITIQCFVTKEGKIKFIEINPRFGGGVPLSIRAGADFPRWILSELAGRRPVIRFGGWKDRLYMLRYDEALWVSGNGRAR